MKSVVNKFDNLLDTICCSYSIDQKQNKNKTLDVKMKVFGKRNGKGRNEKECLRCREPRTGGADQPGSACRRALVHMLIE